MTATQVSTDLDGNGKASALARTRPG